MNEQTPISAIAQAREAKRDKLWRNLQDLFAPYQVPDLWEFARHGSDGRVNDLLQTWCLLCYDAGYDDGFAEGEAIANEPDRNEGYE